MNKKILLTGRPGCGKTTLVKRVMADFVAPAGGFYTEEVRQSGQRVGFEMVTLAGQEALLAHVDFKTPQRVGKYGVDLSALQTVGVVALREAMRARQLVVLDEIGPMELPSAIFRDVVTEIFDIGVPMLATITARPFPFTNALKKRSDVNVIEVRATNREQLVSELSDQFNRLKSKRPAAPKSK
jgi:nucleoside-triphosphatase